MSELWVTFDRNCDDSYREDRMYGEWRESWTNYIRGIHLTNSNFGERVTIDYDVKLGDDVYVLWAEYSSGDSFGHGNRNRVDVVHVFKDPVAAFAARDALLAEDSEGYKTDSGTKINYYRPWTGYFESLDNLHVDKCWVRD